MWDKEVLGGLFNKTTLEWVRATHGRWIADERAGLKERNENKKNKREGGDGECWRWGSSTQRHHHGQPAEAHRSK